MKRYRICFPVFLLIVIVCQGRDAWGENADVLVAKGIEKIQSRDFDEAVELFSRALQTAPDDPEANYYGGYAYVRRGNYAEAEPLLLKALEQDPSAVNAYFQLGLVYAYQKKCEKAEETFSRFQELATDETMKQMAADYVAGCEDGETGETFFTLSATLGGQYDTNVILEPSNPQVPTDKDDFRGLLFLAAGVNPFQSRVADVHVDYDLYQSFHLDLNDFNLNYNRLSPYVEFVLFDRVVPSAGYVFEYTFLKTERYGMNHRGYAQVLVKEGESLSTEAKYEYTNLTYWDTDLFTSNSGRTGYRNTVGVKQNYEKEGLLLNLYGMGDFERVKTDFWSYDGFRFGAEGSVRILSALYLGMEIVYTERRYRSDYPTGNKKRFDQEIDGTVMFTYLISKRVGITVSNNTTVNESNLDIFTYKRNVTGLFITVGIL